MTRRDPACAVLLGVLMGSCRSGPEPVAPIDHPEDPESPAPTVPMADHFIKASIIRDAVIAGDLAATRQPAQWLIDNVVSEDLPVRWRPHVPRVRRAAQGVLDAGSIEQAAAATGALASACGDCHQDTGIELNPTDRGRPLQDAGTYAQMDRHSFAMALMWDGLVGPNEAVWKDGGALMRDAPLHGEAVAEDVSELASRVHELATSSLTLPPRKRGRRYGELLSSCATCHHLVADRPRTKPTGS